MNTHLLGDTCEIIAGQSPPSQFYNSDGIGLPFFQGKADFGELYPKVRVWCSKPNKIAEPGDILISVRAPVGPTNLADKRSCIGRGLAAIRPTDDVDTRYLLHYLRYIEPQLSQTGRGSTFAAITVKELRAVEIPLPPLPEQRRIAAVLDAADTLRAKRRAALAKLDALLQSVFLEMFGDPVRNERGWEVIELGALLDGIRYGTGSPPPYSDNGIPFIRATNVKKGTVIETDMKFITTEAAKSIEKCRLRSGNLIIVRSGVNSGDCALVPERYDGAYLGYDIVLELPRNRAILVNQFINSPQGKSAIEPLTRRAGQPHLNADQIKSIRVVNPSESMLNLFELIWQTIEEARYRNHSSQRFLDSLFLSLQQRAFRGEL